MLVAVKFYRGIIILRNEPFYPWKPAGTYASWSLGVELKIVSCVNWANKIFTAKSSRETNELQTILVLVVIQCFQLGWQL